MPSLLLGGGKSGASASYTFVVAYLGRQALAERLLGAVRDLASILVKFCSNDLHWQIVDRELMPVLRDLALGRVGKVGLLRRLVPEVVRRVQVALDV